MEKHTAINLKKSWGDKESIEARAKRGKATSAPDEETLEIEKRFFEIAQGNKQKVRTLVLGGTPELRDLALSMGSETIAVDISPKLLLALTNVMRFKDDPKNIFMVGDWLKMYRFLDKSSFDIVLADLSINNLPYDLWEDFLKTLSYVMKKKAYFISRHLVFNYPIQIRTCEEVIDEFKKNKNSVFEMIMNLGLSTDVVREGYDHKKKEMTWLPLEKYDKKVKKILTKEEHSFFANMLKYGKELKSIFISEKEYLKIMKKYFDLKARKIVRTIGTTYRLPIYVFKNRKNRLSDLLRRFKK